MKQLRSMHDMWGILIKVFRQLGQGIFLVCCVWLSACASPQPPNCQNITHIPLTITQPGAYCLNQDAQYHSNFDMYPAAINIASHNVLIDLGGHSLTGDGHGIGILATNYIGITVQNGSVNNFDKGIVLAHGQEKLDSHQFQLQNLQLKDNKASGLMVLGNATIIEHVSVLNTGDALSPVLAGFPVGSVIAVYLKGGNSKISSSQVLNTHSTRSGPAYNILLENSDNTRIEGNALSFLAHSGEGNFGISIHHSHSVTIANNTIDGASRAISKDSGSSIINRMNHVLKPSIFSSTRPQQPGYRISLSKDPEWPNWALTLAISPDGQTLAVGGRYDHIFLYDMKTRQRTRALTTNKEGNYALVYRPQGDMLIGGGEDGIIRLWDSKSGALIRSIKAHRGAVSAFAVSADGRLLVSAGDDERVNFWELASGRSIGLLPMNLGKHISYPDPARLIPGLALSPDSHLLAVASVNGLNVWDRNTKTILKSYPGHGLAAAFSPDGRYLIATFGGGDIVIWDTRDWHIEKNHLEYNHSAFGVMFVGKQSNYITYGNGGLQLWNRANNSEMHRFISEPKVSNTIAAAVSPDGKTLVSSGHHSPGDRRMIAVPTIRFWDIASGDETFPVQIPLDEPLRKIIPRLGSGAMALSPNGHDLLVGDAVWDVSTGTIKKQLVRPENVRNKNTEYAVYSRDGKQLITVVDEAIEFWDANTLRYLGSVGDYHIVNFPYYRRVVTSPDGKHLATLSITNRVSVFDIKKRTRVWQIADYSGEPGDLRLPFMAIDIAYAPSSNQLAIAVRPRNKQSFISLRSASSGKEQFVLPADGIEEIMSIAYVRGGRELWASAYSSVKHLSHSIDVFDLSSKSRLAQLYDQRVATTLLVQSHNGKWLASAGIDKTQAALSDCYVNVWNVKERRIVKHLQVCGQRVSPATLINEILFSPDDQRLYLDGMVWDWRSGERISLGSH